MKSSKKKRKKYLHFNSGKDILAVFCFKIASGCCMAKEDAKQACPVFMLKNKFQKYFAGVKMRNFYFLVIFFGFGVILPPGHAAERVVAAEEKTVNVRALDFSFMKEPPNRKIKNRVDLSAIKTAEDLAVVKEAINPVMDFFQVYSQVRAIPSSFSALATSNGIKQMRFPPKIDHLNYYISKKMWNWAVHDPQTIFLSVDFRGMPPDNGAHRETFVFVKRDGAWLFDRHDF
ncbi:hypothetical protein [Janthinobacterium sp. LB2P10]|jgi:hypothetical protein|uniref:hypothetical protein n=1 Tax=Janthinobacterium sp. LB2P10 TaxID=3424194 RepID=UPI003F2843BE